MDWLREREGFVKIAELGICIGFLQHFVEVEATLLQPIYGKWANFLLSVGFRKISISLEMPVTVIVFIHLFLARIKSWVMHFGHHLITTKPRLLFLA